MQHYRWQPGDQAPVRRILDSQNFELTQACRGQPMPEMVTYLD